MPVARSNRIAKPTSSRCKALPKRVSTSAEGSDARLSKGSARRARAVRALRFGARCRCEVGFGSLGEARENYALNAGCRRAAQNNTRIALTLRRIGFVRAREVVAGRGIDLDPDKIVPRVRERPRVRSRRAVRSPSRTPPRTIVWSLPARFAPQQAST